VAQGLTHDVGRQGGGGRPALRVIHLTGGHRAYDIGEEKVRVGPDHRRHLLTIPTQPYEKLYRALGSIGLQPVGVDFLPGPGVEAMHLPPDFQTFSLSSGFAALSGARAWSDVKNVPEQNTPDILDIASRFRTYHRLLTLRVREISEAYRDCLLAQLTDIDGSYKAPNDGTLFSNGFQVHIEAALHAFLADAAGFRDLIAEATWRLVLRESSRDVTTFRSLLKKTRHRATERPLLADFHQAGAQGGWLKILSDLRNAVTHIAPLANTHELHECQIRLQALRGGSAPVMHYPLISGDGSLRARPEPIDFDDEPRLEQRLRLYLDFVNGSQDALAYASQCAEQLIAFATRVREAAGLLHRIRGITDADLVGPIRIYPASG
jgi:hypothetical protein